MISLLIFTLTLLTSPGYSTYVWPNHLYDELEHLLVDQEGFNNGADFKRAITPCTYYVNGNQTLGRMTAAQWLRTAFHDFATADVAAGTGGMDASIGWETDRPENVGSAFNDSLSFFAPFVNQHVSMADLIALSVVISVGVCSSPNIHIPLRGGRVDASEGGTFGVPEPETDIQTTLNQFAQAGFNQQDAIGLTACGHTLGNVHHAGFPQVVGPEAVTPNNTGGGVHFDSTVDVFDVLVVNEYLAGNGQRGGPLVTSDNVTVRSDLRLYTSDNNITMEGLSDSQEHFVSECVSLFARMLDTVPNSTTLSDVIIPLELKPVNITLDFVEDETGFHTVFAGYIRVSAHRC
ncbi:heme peroxidase [Lentinula lateritia]|uniref:Peroxidase n=1 Tax=Lentinula lateritia TaxID=40482 RepID=A0ABQ8VBV6_9AGAR|nr:heme peroxidase [Lentinula lateritia]